MATKPAKPAAEHPPFADMIKEAITSLKERDGSSVAAIRKFIGDKYKGKLPEKYDKITSVQLRRLTDAGKLVKNKASYKLSAEFKAKKPAKKAVKKPAAAKKPAKKTETKVKKTKKPAAKPKESAGDAEAAPAPATEKPKKPKKATKAKPAKAKKATPKKVKKAPAVKAKKPKTAKPKAEKTAKPAKKKTPAKKPAAKKTE